jgi:DNA-binding GntR family transcriptional regulator
MPIQKPISLKVQAYESIKDAILSKEIKHGSIYSEQWLADFFQISRTPVREALLQLRAEGLIEVLPNRGFTLKSVTLMDARIIYQTRIAIEGYCAAYLALHVSQPDATQTLDRIEEMIERCHNNFNSSDEMGFHIEVIKYTNNPVFMQTFTHMRAKIDVFWVEIISRENRMEEVYHEHKRILTCMREGDACGAYQASVDHLNRTYEHIRQTNIFGSSDEK